MSDDDLWRPAEREADEPAPPDASDDADASGSPAEPPTSDLTQPISGTGPSAPPAPPAPPSSTGPGDPVYGAPTGPGAVPPPYNPYAGGYAGQQPGQPGQQPGQPGWGAQPGQFGPPGYVPPPNPYGAPQEFAQPQSPYGSPYQPAYAGGIVPDHPSATTAMVLGIISLAGVVFCLGVTLILSPVAWVVGAKAVREIDAAPARYSGRDRANSGKIMGIIGTVLLVLGVIAVVLFVGLFAVSGSDSGPNPSPTFQQGGA